MYIFHIFKIYILVYFLHIQNIYFYIYAFYVYILYIKYLFLITFKIYLEILAAYVDYLLCFLFMWQARMDTFLFRTWVWLVVIIKT